MTAVRRKARSTISMAVIAAMMVSAVACSGGEKSRAKPKRSGVTVKSKKNRRPPARRVKRKQKHESHPHNHAHPHDDADHHHHPHPHPHLAGPDGHHHPY